MAKEIVNVPATILRELRNSLNIPLTVVAKKFDITVDELNRWESDGVSLTISKARLVAKVFKRHWMVLLLDSLPKKKNLPKEYRNLDFTKTLFTTETILGFQNAERILMLAENINGRVINTKEIADFKVTLNAKLDELVLQIRNWLNIPIQLQLEWESESQALRSWIYAVESKGIYVSEFKFAKEDKIRAFTLSDDKRKVIVLNSTDSNSGKIFSLIHELGHILLSTYGGFDILDFDDLYSDTNRTEVFCNKFAGKLLFPNNAVSTFSAYSGTLDDYLKGYSRKYKISTQVVLRRLFNNGLINKNAFLNKQKELEKAAEEYELKRKEHPFVPPKLFHQKQWIKRNGTAFTLDVLNAQKYKWITYYEAASYLDVKLRYLPDIEFIMNT